MGVPIRLGGGWDSPDEGSGTVPGFMPGWVGVGRVGGCPAWAGRGLGISSTIVDGDPGRYRNLYRVGMGFGCVDGCPLGSGGQLG